MLHNLHEYNSDKDDCGVCFGTNQPDTGNCDCFSTPNGSAYIDNCNDCVGGATNDIACVQDCMGNWGGSATCFDVKIINEGIGPTGMGANTKFSFSGGVSYFEEEIVSGGIIIKRDVFNENSTITVIAVIAYDENWANPTTISETFQADSHKLVHLYGPIFQNQIIISEWDGN